MSDQPQIGFARKFLSWCLLTFGCCCIFFLDRVDIVMNASNSMEDPAYLMLDTPIYIHRGAIVAAEMPEVLQAQYDGFQFVKRVKGMPGEEITLDANGNPCIAGHECFPLFVKDGVPVAAAIEPGVIPDDHYAVFGTSADSLDSRYSAIGLIHKDELLGQGVAMPWAPDWRKE